MSDRELHEIYVMRRTGAVPKHWSTSGLDRVFVGALSVETILGTIKQYTLVPAIDPIAGDATIFDHEWRRTKFAHSDEAIRYAASRYRDALRRGLWREDRTQPGPASGSAACRGAGHGGVSGGRAS